MEATAQTGVSANAENWHTLTPQQRLEALPHLTQAQAAAVTCFYYAQDVSHINQKTAQQQAAFALKCNEWETYSAAQRKQLLTHLSESELKLPYFEAESVNRCKKIILKHTGKTNGYKTETGYQETDRTGAHAPNPNRAELHRGTAVAYKPTNSSKNTGSGEGVQGLLF